MQNITDLKNEEILILLNPFIPHFSSECLSDLSKFRKINFTIWPEIDQKYLSDERINLVVQINGKKREVLNIEKDLDQNKVFEIIKLNEKINNYIKDKDIIKKIFVQNKILNLIVK